MAAKRSMLTSAAVQTRARELRRTPTPAEEKLWRRLRNRQLGGLKFRRQHPIGGYIVDFYCAAHHLVVEIDGGIHATQRQADQDRNRELEALGCRVIRFSNQQVGTDLEWVLQEILEAAR
jgi:very-short-patch-repair endonuclease